MTVYLDIADQYKNLINTSQIKNSILVSLKHQGVSPNSDISILVDDDQRIQILNRDYRAVDAPTDVLAFPSDFIDPDTGHKNLGDIIISFPQAKNEAQKGGHSVDAELQLLVVHGVLHLLGFKHLEPADKDIMWSAQSQILGDLNSQVTVPE